MNVFKQVTIWSLGVVGIVATGLSAQDSIYGTWKLDFDKLAADMRAAGMDSSQIELRLGRMKQIRYMLSANEITIVQDGYPNTLSWKLVSRGDNEFEFKNLNGSEQIRLKIAGMEQLVMTTITGQHEMEVVLVKESDLDAWQRPADFQIGMAAPPVEIMHWLTKPTKPIQFGDGKVYVIDFWATWCAPCLEQMPKLVELQKNIGVEELSIIAVTRESLDDVSKFVQQLPSPASNNNKGIGERIREMSQTISIGVDQSDQTFRAYMVASGTRAIPTLCIVGKTGRVEWMGSHADFEETLQQVLDGTWNQEEFGERFVGYQRAYNEFPRIQQLAASGQIEAAISLIVELQEIANEPLQLQLEALKARLSQAK
ncbi:MAG: TlpA family protein disulfide reductase [Planctomycetales bacterium]|nr:TlpA family protein disulfide reductase [Planctomycetales bacterium]